MGRYLLDTNVLVYSQTRSPHHARCAAFLERGEEMFITVVVFSEFHYQLTRLLGSGEADGRAEALLASPSIGLLEVNRATLQRALGLRRRHGLTTNDALIAQSAIENRLLLATFDRDFRRVGGLEVVEP